MYDAIFDEDVELENYIVAGAPHGGAIGRFIFDSYRASADETALLYDESKPYRYRDAPSAKSSIDIYSCSGKYISRINVCLILPPLSH